MNNKKLPAIDPFTGEYFEPKRSNQVFACEKNRIDYNNHRAKKLRNELNRINRILMKNFRILNELTAESIKLKISKLDLYRHGFDFRFMTHFSKRGNKSIPTIYYFSIEKSDDETYEITKLEI